MLCYAMLCYAMLCYVFSPPSTVVRSDDETTSNVVERVETSRKEKRGDADRDDGEGVEVAAMATAAAAAGYPCVRSVLMEKRLGRLRVPRGGGGGGGGSGSSGGGMVTVTVTTMMHERKVGSLDVTLLMRFPFRVSTLPPFALVLGLVSSIRTASDKREDKKREGY
ncbi:hypothetical protein V1477_005342 [Vespula maculifrons]|uniref:Uncharacterized protein n=1 Tax=Vespula maculifrons TaxID=7453 RepID=A0ABD2CPD4_VESMC